MTLVDGSSLAQLPEVRIDWTSVGQQMQSKFSEETTIFSSQLNDRSAVVIKLGGLLKSLPELKRMKGKEVGVKVVVGAFVIERDGDISVIGTGEGGEDVFVALKAKVKINFKNFFFNFCSLRNKWYGVRSSADQLFHDYGSR